MKYKHYRVVQNQKNNVYSALHYQTQPMNKNGAVLGGKVNHRWMFRIIAISCLNKSHLMSYLRNYNWCFNLQVVTDFCIPQLAQFLSRNPSYFPCPTKKEQCHHEIQLYTVYQEHCKYSEIPFSRSGDHLNNPYALIIELLI